MVVVFFFFVMRVPPRSTHGRSSAAAEVYKKQPSNRTTPVFELTSYHTIDARDLGLLSKHGPLSVAATGQLSFTVSACGLFSRRVVVTSRPAVPPGTSVPRSNASQITVSRITIWPCVGNPAQSEWTSRSLTSRRRHRSASGGHRLVGVRNSRPATLLGQDCQQR